MNNNDILILLIEIEKYLTINDIETSKRLIKSFKELVLLEKQQIEPLNYTSSEYIGYKYEKKII